MPKKYETIKKHLKKQFTIVHCSEIVREFSRKNTNVNVAFLSGNFSSVKSFGFYLSVHFICTLLIIKVHYHYYLILAHFPPIRDYLFKSFPILQ